MSLHDDVARLRDDLASVSQTVLDEWDWEDGGCCDAMANEHAGVVAEAGFDVLEGGHDGDDHAWLIVYDRKRQQAVGLNLPAGVYETGGGYSWKPILGAEIEGGDFHIWAVDWSDIAPELD